jgi:thiol-disulfide isomerase/thioredoxin
MKKLLTLAIWLSVSASGFAQIPYTIHGKVLPPDEGKKIYLVSLEDGKKLDSTIVKNKAFAFKGTAKAPTFATAYIKFGATSFMPYLLDKVPLVLDLKESKPVVLKGSVDNVELRDFFTQMTPITLEQQRIGNDARKLMNKSGGKLTKAQEDSIDVIWNKAQQRAHDVLVENLNKDIKSYVPIFLIGNYSSLLSTEEKQKYLSMPGEFQKHIMTQSLKQQLSAVKRGAAGTQFTDFTMNDTEGTPHKLSEYIGKGKYVLVDFWASWCGPCRAEMPNVKALYDKYKSKFDIVGISLDNDKKAWLNGISQLGITWHQLSDLKGWQNEGAALYGIRAIPATLLIDPNGKIVAQNLRGDDLSKKLAELLN